MVNTLRTNGVDPLVSIALLIVTFWGSLMLIFFITKTVLLPLGLSDRGAETSFIIHFTKSLVFLCLVGALFYAWFRLTRKVRDSYLNNKP